MLTTADIKDKHEFKQETVTGTTPPIVGRMGVLETTIIQVKVVTINPWDTRTMQHWKTKRVEAQSIVDDEQG